MGWLLDALTDWIWTEFVERMSRGKPRWVWVLWALSPALVVALLFGVLWLSFR